MTRVWLKIFDVKILIHSINYFPELTGVGKYTGEMAEWLAARGHEVRVVTAPPYYPEWKVEKAYSGLRYAKENINGVTVCRCPLWVPSKPSGLKRILHLASFALSSFAVVLGQVFWRPDVVFVVEPPLFCALSALLLARLCGAKSWLHVQDFEVDAAFALGLLPSGRIRNLVLFVESFLLQHFDRVSTIASKMAECLESKSVDPGKVFLFPNWVDTRAIYPLESSPMKGELGFSEDETVCLYSGNMGEKQGLEILIEVARLLADESSIRFVLCGNGGVRERLFESGKNIPNIIWLPLQPVERLNQLLNLADIHLLPQRADAADLVMPSKLTGMLSSGRPIIATVNTDTEIARIVTQCGRIVEPGNAQDLAKAIIELAFDKTLRISLGNEARRLALEYFERDAVLTRFEVEVSLMSKTSKSVQ